MPNDLLQKVGFASQEPPPLLLTAAQMRANLRNILAFQKVARQKNMKLLFVVIPTKQEVAKQDPVTDAGTWMMPADQIDDFLRLHHIDHIDPTDIFRQSHKQLYWNLDGHLNPDGNHVLGLVVAQHLAQESASSTLLAKIDDMLAEELK
jgi:hypothetical protein